MNLQSLMAGLGALIWASIWWLVGREFHPVAALAGVVVGGFFGLLLGWFFVELLNTVTPNQGFARTATKLAACAGGFAAFVGVPLWALSVVRAH
jgi:hypothetical protein